MVLEFINSYITRVPQKNFKIFPWYSSTMENSISPNSSTQKLVPTYFQNNGRFTTQFTKMCYLAIFTPRISYFVGLHVLLSKRLSPPVLMQAVKCLQLAHLSKLPFLLFFFFFFLQKNICVCVQIHEKHSVFPIGKILVFQLFFFFT